MTTVRVDCGTWKGPLRRIWTSFGYDELNWTYMPSGKRHLRTIGEFAEQPYYVRQHYIFNSGIGWSVPHWGAGNVYHEHPDGTPFYDFAIADQVYDAVVQAGHRPLVELAFTPRALVPEGAEQRFAYEPSSTQGSPYEAACGRCHRATTPGSAASCARWSSTASRATAPSTCAAGSGSCGTSRTSTTGAAPPSSSFLAHCARQGTPLDFVSFHTKGARYTPWRVYGPLGGPAPQRQLPSTLRMLREVRAALDAVNEHPRFRELPAWWTSATPRCPRTGASTTTPTSPIATPSTSPSSSAS